MKKIFLIIGCLSLFVLSFSFILIKNDFFIETIEYTIEKNTEVYSEIYIHDFIDFDYLEIISKNDLIDTSNLGKQEIVIEYIDLDNIKNYLTIYLEIIDSTNPLISSSSSYTVLQNSELTLLDSILCGDNYDAFLSCEIIGDYDTSVIDSYPLSFYAVDSSGNETTKNFTLNVVEKTNSSSSEVTGVLIDDFIDLYKTDNTKIGIDVSVWQGEIDFSKVKEAGVEFVIFRIGYGHNYNGDIILDSTFEYNLKNAKEAGLEVGIYFFSYSITSKSAIEQASWVIEQLDGVELDLPIVYDWETWSGFNNYEMSFYNLNQMASSFLEEIIDNGYDAMLYSSAYYLNNIWDIDYPTWLAHYTSETDYDGQYYIWQQTDKGIVDGIDAFVDLNVLYVGNVYE
ncbi:MAG: GH25 family lysozyme [Mycoplasmatota bacterium]